MFWQSVSKDHILISKSIILYEKGLNGLIVYQEKRKVCIIRLLLEETDIDQQKRN